MRPTPVGVRRRRLGRQARLADNAGLGSDPSDNGSHYILVPMRSRVLRRRSATARVYSRRLSASLTTIVATRGLGVSDYAKFAAILAATGFFQVLLDLTVEDALVKYGFRYVETEQWGRLRRMFESALLFKIAGGVLAGIAIVAAGAVRAARSGASAACSTDADRGSLLPVVQAPENVGAARSSCAAATTCAAVFGRLDRLCASSASGIGMSFGLDGAVVGLILAQVFMTAAISIVGFGAFRRFPQVRSETLGSDRRDVRQFVIASTIGSSLTSARATLGTALLPAWSRVDQAAYFRNAQAPATGLATSARPRGSCC